MKYKFVKQHSEEDCGAACIATIAKHYGHNFTLNHIREAIGTGQLGTTLLGLRRGAETLGFNTRPVKTSPELLNRMHEAPLPAIIHWKGNHWVVLYGKKGKKCLIADPAVGIRYLSKQDLAEGWTDWLMLLLEPDPVRFFAQKDEQIGGFWRFFKRVWNYRAILAREHVNFVRTYELLNSGKINENRGRKQFSQQQWNQLIRKKSRNIFKP